MKKKLEADINELEVALENANAANAEAQRTIKRYQVCTKICYVRIQVRINEDPSRTRGLAVMQAHIKEAQSELEAEQEAKDRSREALTTAERKAHGLQNELEETKTQLELVRKVYMHWWNKGHMVGLFRLIALVEEPRRI